MTKEQVENIQDAARAAQSEAEDGEKRERSTIQFPYNDLDDAATVASPAPVPEPKAAEQWSEETFAELERITRPPAKAKPKAHPKKMTARR